MEAGPNFAPICRVLALVWVPALALLCVHVWWPADAIGTQLHPGALQAIKDGEVPPLVAQCETGIVAAHQAGEISAAAMTAALPKCYPLAETHQDPIDIVIAALKFATQHDPAHGDGGGKPRHQPPAPASPPPPPPAPDCATSMRHAQLEYVRNRFCEFGSSFATEKTAKASPADLVMAAYTSAIVLKGGGTKGCRMLAVGSDPSVRATATFMAQAGKALRCDVRLYETDLSAITAHLNDGGSKAYTHMGLIMGAKSGKTRVTLGGVKKKKTKKTALFAAQESKAIMEVKTVTPENEMCSNGVHKLGHCLKYKVELLHVGRGAPFNLVVNHAGSLLSNKKIQAVVFDGRGAEATVMEKFGYVVYLVGAPNKGGTQPVLIRIDSKWAHSNYGRYSGGTRGNGDKMVKTYFAVAPEHAFNEAAVTKGMMVCDERCQCVPEDKCECVDEQSRDELCTGRVP